jgi:hypothetical protein
VGAIKGTPDSTVFLIQEFVSVGEYGFWSTTSSLEVVSLRPRIKAS